MPSPHAQIGSVGVVPLTETVANNLPADSVIGNPHAGYGIEGYSNCYIGQTGETLPCDNRGLLTKWVLSESCLKCDVVSCKR